MLIWYLELVLNELDIDNVACSIVLCCPDAFYLHFSNKDSTTAVNTIANKADWVWLCKTMSNDVVVPGPSAPTHLTVNFIIHYNIYYLYTLDVIQSANKEKRKGRKTGS